MKTFALIFLLCFLLQHSEAIRCYAGFGKNTKVTECQNSVLIKLDQCYRLEIDATLETHRYLCGNQVTLADVRLFTTLFRFDAVYYGLFKCNRRRIQDYRHLGAYLRDLYQLPGVAGTCDLEAVKRDYYGNLFPLNPGGIIPAGPDITSFLQPHHREKFG